MTFGPKVPKISSKAVSKLKTEIIVTGSWSTMSFVSVGCMLIRGGTGGFGLLCSIEKYDVFRRFSTGSAGRVSAGILLDICGDDDILFGRFHGINAVRDGSDVIGSNFLSGEGEKWERLDECLGGVFDFRCDLKGDGRGECDRERNFRERDLRDECDF